MNLTDEQNGFANHQNGVFVEACPGAGKTRTVLARMNNITNTLPPRRGVALLSFTNKAIEEFRERTASEDLRNIIQFPNFIGTFDSFVRHFLFLPYGVPGNSNKPHVVDSWKSLDVEVVLNGVAAQGISLECFDSRTNALNVNSVLRTQATIARTRRADYERAARTRRENLHRKGYFSASDARAISLDRIRDPHSGEALGRAIAARFHEVIVDEAQDCNPEDLEILRWLRGHGVQITMVCDLDQSIYEFRDGAPTYLSEFRDTYNAQDRIRLTGNFRCSPAICSLAASLRELTNIDVSRGDTNTCTHPIAICVYNGSVSGQIGTWFAGHASQETIDIPVQELMVLAHANKTARLASGNFRPPPNGTSKVERLASAIGEFWAGATNSSKTKALSSVEKMILDMTGQREADEPVTKTTERLNLDKRLLRRQALEVVMKVPRICVDTDEARTAWLVQARQVFTNLNLDLAQGITVTSYLRQPPNGTWSMHLEEAEEGSVLPYSTIHTAKGSEYSGVCVVLPQDPRTVELFNHWESRTAAEAKRVVYVGVTRGMYLSAIAIPEAHLAQCERILAAADVPYQVHRIDQ